MYGRMDSAAPVTGLRLQPALMGLDLALRGLDPAIARL